MMLIGDIDKPNITYFNSAKGSSGRFHEKHIQNKYPQFYQYLNEIYKDFNISFKEKLYWYFYDIHDYPTCPICGEKTKYQCFNKGYLKYCSYECAYTSSTRINSFKQTNLKKYGVEHPTKSKEIKEKIKQTNLKKYGVEHPMKSKEIKEKIKQTNLKKYGVENIFLSPKIKDKIKQTNLEKYGVDNPMKSKEIYEKAIKTMNEKYGGVGFNSNQIKQKIETTIQQKYGVSEVSKSQEIQDKKKKNCINKYGVEHYSQTQEFKDKYKQTCLEKYGVDHIFKLDSFKQSNLNKLWNKVKSKDPNVIDIEKKNDNIMYIHSCTHLECNLCQSKIFKIPTSVYHNRKYSKTELCTTILPIQYDRISNTTIEQFIKNILDTHHFPYVENDRKILKGRELDIYIPTHNLAIECNGIYWHSLKEPSYHFNKWKECKEQDIQLLTIWEDQIINKPQIIEGIVKSHLGIYEHQIGARKCILKEVRSKESNKFLEENHLQGKVNGSIRLGLYYNNELVSLMVLGTKRIVLGNKNDKETYELYRYCNKLGWQIQGGASKLFKHFLQEHPNCTIESFSSNDISIGNLYKKLRFELIDVQKGSYWYINKNMQRYHRYSFRKDTLVKKGYDPSKTEFEITDEIGLLRIYDSGQQKWIFS